MIGPSGLNAWCHAMQARTLDYTNHGIQGTPGTHHYKLLLKSMIRGCTKALFGFVHWKPFYVVLKGTKEHPPHLIGF